MSIELDLQGILDNIYEEYLEENGRSNKEEYFAEYLEGDRKKAMQLAKDKLQNAFQNIINNN